MVVIPRHPPKPPRAAPEPQLNRATLCLLALCAFLALPLGASDHVFEAIRDATHRQRRIGGVLPPGRYHPKNGDQFLIAGYLFDAGVGVFFNEIFADPATPSAENWHLEAYDPAYEQPADTRAADRQFLRALNSGNWYLPYPYALGLDGYIYQSGHDSAVRQSAAADSHAPRLTLAFLHQTLRQNVYAAAADQSYDFAHRLGTARATLRGAAIGVIELDASWAYLHEDLDAGATDEMGLSDCNLVICFVSMPRARLRAGFGANFMEDGRNSARGANLTALVDLYPVRPFVCSLEIDAGTLGTAFLFHLHLQAGVLLGRFEFYAGYDYLAVQNIPIRGPLAGIRLYF